MIFKSNLQQGKVVIAVLLLHAPKNAFNVMYQQIRVIVCLCRNARFAKTTSPVSKQQPTPPALLHTVLHTRQLLKLLMFIRPSMVLRTLRVGDEPIKHMYAAWNYDNHPAAASMASKFCKPIFGQWIQMQQTSQSQFVQPTRD